MWWTAIVDGGPRRVNHAAVAIDDYIYSFGGYCSGADYDRCFPIDVHVFNTQTYVWNYLMTPQDSLLQNAPYQRYGHTAVGYRGNCYIWGGRNDVNGACDVLFEFDPRCSSWKRVRATGVFPPARDGHSACVYKDQMVVFGGYEELFLRFSNETYLFDFRNLSWLEIRPTGTPPSWRDFHTATMLGDRMYVFGGRSDQAGQYHTSKEIYFEETKYLDLERQAWCSVRSKGIIPCGRRSHSAWEYNGDMYIFGGYNGIDDKHFNDVYRFSAATARWSLTNVLGRGPSPRRRQCCVVVNDRMYLFGGTSPVRNGAACNVNDPMWPERNLIDHSDLYIMDMNPSLKSLAMITVMNNPVLCSQVNKLPGTLINEIMKSTSSNKTSIPRCDFNG